MFWSFGSSYLLGLQALAAATFAWGRWQDPGLGGGSGFWVAGGATLVIGLWGLAFETVALFWTPPGTAPRWWAVLLRQILFGALAAFAAWGLLPFLLALAQSLLEGRWN